MMPAALGGDQMSHSSSVLPFQITQIFCSSCLISRSVTHLGCLIRPGPLVVQCNATFLKFENNLDHDFTSRTSRKARQTGDEPFAWAVFVCKTATMPTSRPCGHRLEVQCAWKREKKKRQGHTFKMFGLRQTFL